MLPAQPLVSVIIPVHNDFARLRLCLDALREQTWGLRHLEVIVVDNGSTGDISHVTQSYPFVKLYQEAMPGSYAARNKGIEQVTGQVVAFTDSDCLPMANWIEQGVLALQRYGENAIVGGQVVLFAANNTEPTLAEEFELAVGFSQQSYIETKHYSVTANLFTTPQVFSKVGRFDALLKSGGDKEWGVRAYNKGIPLYFEQNAIIRHPARRTLPELFKKRARVVGGHLAIARSRYPEWLAFSLVLGKACLPPLQRVLSTGQNSSKSGSAARPRRGIRRSLKVAAVGVSLQAFSAVELVRLKLGKPPVR